LNHDYRCNLPASKQYPLNRPPLANASCHYRSVEEVPVVLAAVAAVAGRVVRILEGVAAQVAYICATGEALRTGVIRQQIEVMGQAMLDGKQHRIVHAA